MSPRTTLVHSTLPYTGRSSLGSRAASFVQRTPSVAGLKWSKYSFVCCTLSRWHARNGPLTDARASDLEKPAVDRVQPRTGSRDEMNGHARMAAEPSAHRKGVKSMDKP